MIDFILIINYYFGDIQYFLLEIMALYLTKKSKFFYIFNYFVKISN